MVRQSADMNVLVVLCLAVPMVSAQRATWKFTVSTFDPQFACNTNTILSASMDLCKAVCKAGTCTDRSIGRYLNLNSADVQAAYGTSCLNKNQGLTSTAACNSSGYLPSVCPIPPVWPKQCPVSPSCCVSNHPTVPDSVVQGSGAEVRVLTPQLRVGYSNPLDRALGITITAQTTVWYCESDNHLLQFDTKVNVWQSSDMVSVDEDPGVPIGMNATVAMDNRSVTMVWFPRDGQEGFIPTVALNVRAGGSRVLLQLPVKAPVAVWMMPTSVDVSDSDTLIAAVGSTAVAPVQCVSNYPGYISYAAGFVPPPGAVLANVTAPQQFLWDGGLGVGATTGMIGPAPTIAAEFRYTPPHGAEGSEFTACFECTVFPMLSAPTMDPSGALVGERCVKVHVPVCTYVANPGDTLLSVSQQLYQNNNWRRLWNANAGMIADPTAPLPLGMALSLGPTYLSRPGDTLAIVAGRFSSTVKDLLKVNPFIASLPDQALMPGMRMCVPTCNHKPNPSDNIANPY